MALTAIASGKSQERCAEPADAEEMPQVRHEGTRFEDVGPEIDVLAGWSLREPQGAVEGVRHDAHGDAVHHDRRHDLVGPRLHLEDPRYGRVDHAADTGEEERGREVEQSGQEVEGERGPRRRDHRHQELALDSDVEQASLEADRHCERREDQRRCDREHRRDARDVSEREIEHRTVHRERALAVQDDDQRAHADRDGEGGEQGETLAYRRLQPRRQRAGCGQRLGSGRHQLASAVLAAPSIPAPSSSGGVSGVYSPVIRPS